MQTAEFDFSFTRGTQTGRLQAEEGESIGTSEGVEQPLDWSLQQNVAPHLFTTHTPSECLYSLA